MIILYTSLIFTVGSTEEDKRQEFEHYQSVDYCHGNAFLIHLNVGQKPWEYAGGEALVLLDNIFHF